MSEPEDPGANQVARRRRQLVVVAGVAVLAAATGLVAGNFVRSPASVAAETAPPPVTSLTSEVEQRAITETVIARGEARIAGRLELTPGAPPDGMKSVVTRVATKVGDQVSSGQVLLEVAERPMFVLRGKLPMYRDIAPGDTGKDVAQLQSALRELGWYVGDREGVYGVSTQAAVSNQYRIMGYQPLRTEAAPIESDESSDDTTEESLGPLSDSGLVVRTSAPRLQSRKVKAEPTGPIVAMAECFFVPRSPSTVTKLSARSGGTVHAPAVTLSTSALTVRANVNPADGEALKVGQEVRIQDESGELDVKGRVAKVGAPRVDETNGMSIPVTVRPNKRLALRWSGQAVRVSFPTRKTSKDALVVPLAAVSSGVDGRITVVRVDGARKRRIEVGVGMRGDGYVEIQPTKAGSLSVGDDVLLGK
jgi:HlyD family secretion protein